MENQNKRRKSSGSRRVNGNFRIENDPSSDVAALKHSLNNRAVIKNQAYIVWLRTFTNLSFQEWREKQQKEKG
jgi:hypothetical protein